MRELIRGCGIIKIVGDVDIDITNITCDSRKVRSGFAFIAVKGFTTDGHNYIGEAIRAGAGAVVYEDKDAVREYLATDRNTETTAGGFSNGSAAPAFVQVKSSRYATAIIAANFYDNPSEKLALVGITGTNGKTTTTALAGAILKTYYPDVYVVGNIGEPYTDTALKTTDDSVTVTEISSFQLETIIALHPHVSAILNITPDHLNRHHTMENYTEAKLAITKNQTEDMVCVLNYEDEILREHADDIRAEIVWFSSLRRLDAGLYLEGDRILYADGESVTEVIGTGELNILGRHNYENVMAASAMAIRYGVPMEKIRESLRDFQAVEHRIEYVTEKRGVRFYNDSKGTNPDAAIRAIQAMDRPTCLIGGGYDKDSVYTEWIRAFDGKVKFLVLIGQTREKIAEQAEALGFTDYVFADSLQEAVDLCFEKAVSGDAVLLSPACASWGMFPNYEVRGKMFKEMVNALEE